MDPIMVALLVTLLALSVFGIQLRGAITRPLIVHFGPSEPMSLRPEERRLLFQEAARQQRLAFALLTIAIALGIVLGTALIGRAIAGKSLDVTTVGLAITAAGDIALAAGAWKLYRAASTRLDEVTSRIASV